MSSAAAGENVLSRIDNLPELLPIPAVAFELSKACSDANVTVADLCQVVNCDASLALRMLQVANSARFGCAGRINSIEHAAVILGLRGMREIAMSVVAEGLFQNSGDDSAASNPVDQLWDHSLGCATVAKSVADSTLEACPNEAFVAGLLHDVGKLILIRMDVGYDELLSTCTDGEVDVATEIEKYGISNGELGGRYLESWGVPFELTEVLRIQHEPLDSAEHTGMSRVISMADELSRFWRIGSNVEIPTLNETMPLEETQLEVIREQSLEDYGVNVEVFGASC